MFCKNQVTRNQDCIGFDPNHSKNKSDFTEPELFPNSAAISGIKIASVFCQKMWSIHF